MDKRVGFKKVLCYLFNTWTCIIQFIYNIVLFYHQLPDAHSGIQSISVDAEGTHMAAVTDKVSSEAINIAGHLL